MREAINFQHFEMKKLCHEYINVEERGKFAFYLWRGLDWTKKHALIISLFRFGYIRVIESEILLFVFVRRKASQTLGHWINDDTLIRPIVLPLIIPNFHALYKNSFFPLSEIILHSFVDVGESERKKNNQKNFPVEIGIEFESN